MLFGEREVEPAIGDRCLQRFHSQTPKKEIVEQDVHSARFALRRSIGFREERNSRSGEFASRDRHFAEVAAKMAEETVRDGVNLDFSMWSLQSRFDIACGERLEVVHRRTPEQRSRSSANQPRKVSYGMPRRGSSFIV